MSIRPDPTSFEPELAARLDEAARRSRHDPDTARTELDDVIADADNAALPLLAARGRYALARVLVSLGSADSALTLITDAERGFRAAGEIGDAIRTNLGRMNVLDELGRHADAVAVGRSMLANLSEDTADDESVWLRAAAQENLGVALGYLGRHREALVAYAAASATYAELGLEADAARAMANRGVELTELARPADAIDALERASARFVDVGDRLWQALCQTNLSEAWIAAGRYLEAFRCLDAAESALGGLDQTTEWLRAQLARADCLRSLHLDVEALDLYDELVRPLSEAGLVGDQGRVQLGRGIVLARSGGASELARAAFDTAIASFEASGDVPMLARAHLAVAPLTDDAMACIDRAVDLLGNGDRPADLASALLSAAEQLERADPALASASLDRAADLIEPLGVPELRWRLHHRRGRLLRLAGATDGARRELELAITQLETIRASVDRDGIRQRYDGARSGPFDDLVELLLDASAEDAAFALGDSIRSRGLVERLDSDGPPAIDAPPDELLSIYDRLLLARGPQVSELAARARTLERRARGASDVSATAVPESPGIDRNRVVFHTLGDEVVAFVAGGNGHVVAFRKLCELSATVALLERLEAQWRRFAHPDVVARHAGRLEQATIDVLRRLHDLLIGPLHHQLSPELPLTIVADGAIGSVPFAALHDGESYVVERQAVRQTPSIAVDRHLRRPTRAPTSVLAMGTDDDYAPLAALEARLVGEMWPSQTVRDGSRATAEEMFGAASDHDVVHIAGHGLFRPDAPEFSAIRLADRWVTAAEIARLELDGQLVVLSACDTGRRRIDRPMREVLGLPRAFLAAGAGGVIVNLWPADDRATAELMTTLHRRLAAGEPAAVALRTAQLDARSRRSHPYFWGGSTLIGGPDPVSIDPRRAAS